MSVLTQERLKEVLHYDDDSKSVYLGLHISLELAKQAVREARELHHREFSNHGL